MTGPHPQKSCDILVIGGGAIGLATALSLAREGLAVTVVDRSRCGQESSWAGAGMVQTGGWHRNDTLAELQRASLKLYPGFAADLRERTGVDPEFHCCGSLEPLTTGQQCQRTAAEVTAAASHERVWGRPVVQLLSPEEARRLVPGLSTEMAGARFCPVAGQVRNPRLLRALRVACQQSGVTIREGVAVTGLCKAGERVTGVHTKAGDISAGQVVLAAGAWSSRIDPALADLMPVFPVRGQIVLLKMPARPFEPLIERGRNYLVPRGDGRILVGATQEPDAGFVNTVTAAGMHELLDFATGLVPPLAEATVECTWAGLRPGTPDKRPYLGAVPGWPGLCAATGHFRSGLTLTPVTARIITELITRGKTSYPLQGCEPGRALEKRRPAHQGRPSPPQLHRLG